MGNTLGTLFIGVILAAVLFGLTNIQAFVYWQAHGHSGILSFFKLVVIWLWILDALHLALVIHGVYYYLVTNYANPSALMEVIWSLQLGIVVNVLITFTVQLLYVHCIWKVSKGRSRVIPTIALGIVVVIGLGVSIPLLWALYNVKFFKNLAGIAWSIYLSLGAATFIDVIIASSLCYLLATSRTGFSSTDSFITKLVGYIISTGCLTSICSMSIIITSAVMPTNFIYIALQFLVTKLYANSFIAFLNARHYMQANATVDSPQFHDRQGVYRPELHIGASQHEELQKSQKDPADAVLHITQPIHDVSPPAGSLFDMKPLSLM